MRAEKYNGSLTREQWLLRETCLVAQLRSDEGLSDEAIVERIVSQNLFQYPTERTLRSIARACCKRLDALSDDPNVRERLTWLLAHGLPEQVRQINLYALMRAYRVVWEFMTCVVASKNRTFDQNLAPFEVADFLEGLRLQDQTVAQWSDATLNKIRQVLVKCLAECGMYDRSRKALVPVLLDLELEEAMRSNGDEAALVAFGCLE